MANAEIRRLKIKSGFYIYKKENFLYFCAPLARVAELVDALDSKSSVFGRAGSIPASSTKALLIY